MVKVIATERGFFADTLREEGDVFDCQTKDIGSWMRKVTKKDVEAAEEVTEAEASDEESESE